MKRGDVIIVTDYFGEKLTRAVADWDEVYVFVCDPLEWEAAQKERRDPVSIGFARRFVVDRRAA
jgi:hypothetical protein